MIDWKEIRIDDLQFSICGDEIREQGDSVFIPVEVLNAEGRAVFRHIACLRQSFYTDLRSLAEWKEQLHNICRARVIQAVRERQQQIKVPVEDKMEVFNAPSQNF